MALAPSDSSNEPRYTTERYLGLFARGVLGPDDKVELLEGVVVAMSPSNPAHDSAITRVTRALYEVIGRQAVIRVQCAFNAGRYSMPEPDIAVVPGRESDYDDAHPSQALLIVEVADSSLVQDRLTKAAIYAAAGVPEYWIVNLRDERIEIFGTPDPEHRRYEQSSAAHRGERVPVSSFSASVAVDDMLPGH